MTPTTDGILFRAATIQDEPFLWEMLYHAIYVLPGQPPPPTDIIHQPELSRYVAGWGGPDDIGVVAEVAGQLAGAAWLRLSGGGRAGYGYVDDRTPELTIAVLPGYRAQGIGNELLSRLLAEASHRYPAVSLSVIAANPARRLYERHGFVIVADHGGSLTMIRHFAPSDRAAMISA